MKRYNVYTDQDYASSRPFFFHYSRLEVSFSRIEVPCTFYLLHTHFQPISYPMAHFGSGHYARTKRDIPTCTMGLGQEIVVGDSLPHAQREVWCFMFRSRACLGCYDCWNACVFGWIRPNPELAFGCCLVTITCQLTHFLTTLGHLVWVSQHSIVSESHTHGVTVSEPHT